MLLTKDLWNATSDSDKLKNIAAVLDQIHSIETNRHPLSNKFNQGKLAAVKHDLEHFVINALGWESERLLSKRH